MSRARRVARDRFEVDFADTGWVGRLWPFGTRPAVDPQGIAEAVLGAMRACELRSAHGAPLVWNEYRVFLAREDFDALRAVMGRTAAALDTLLRREIERLGAETVGEPVVVLRTDEALDIPLNRGVLEVGFAETQRRPDGPDQVTIRLGRPAPGVSEPAPGGSSAAPGQPPPPRDEATLRVGPSSAGGRPLRLRWGPHTALVPAGAVVRVGRPHADPPADFVALSGEQDNMRISRVHIVLDHRGPVPVLHRPSQANPVQVGDIVVQAGAHMSLESPTARILLANDQLELVVERT